MKYLTLAAENLWTNTRSTQADPTEIITDHVRSTKEGNVFTHVCDSAHREGGGGGGGGAGP